MTKNLSLSCPTKKGKAMPKSDPSLVLAGAAAMELLGFRPLPTAGSPLARWRLIERQDLMAVIRFVSKTLAGIDKEHPELGLRGAIPELLGRPFDPDPLRHLCQDLAALVERARPFWPKPLAETEAPLVMDA